VVGGGFGGATAAKYIRRLDASIDVILVERNPAYITCPMSNTYLSGIRDFQSLQRSYELLPENYGVTVVHDHVSAIDPERSKVILARGEQISFDRLILAPGIEFNTNRIEGYDDSAAEYIPHAWRGGKQLALLKQQLIAMRNGGSLAISVPAAPFRCPPGPYERASLIAHYFKTHKPRSKILILDANESFSKQALFLEAWEQLYPGMIEWIPLSNDGAVRRVEPQARILHTELDEFQVDVANLIPPQTAARAAADAGLTDATGWCPVDYTTFESLQIPGIHVIGDACSANPMPKSGSAANSQAKNCALAVTAMLRGAPSSTPSLHNTCYSLIDPDYGISVSMIYRVRNGEIKGVPGAGGVSPLHASRRFREQEAKYAYGWYDSITADSFG